MGELIGVGTLLARIAGLCLLVLKCVWHHDRLEAGVHLNLRIYRTGGILWAWAPTRPPCAGEGSHGVCRLNLGFGGRRGAAPR